jgi:ribulose-phosphate 3-epimerase
MSVIVAPSVLSADFANLGRDIDMLNHSEAEWIHIDVMDGVFVPNISFGFPVLEAISKRTEKVCDVHLMIVNPEKYVHQFIKAGANNITIHYEGNIHLDSIIRTIEQQGISAGVAINPATPVSVLKEIITLLDVVLIMSVNPGFGGQKFITSTLDKIAEAKQLIEASGSLAKIQVDGGVGLNNAKEIIAAGADILVAGNAVFGSTDPTKTISAIKHAATK